MKKLSQKTKKISQKIYLHFIEPQIKIETFEFFDASKIDKIKDGFLEEIIIQDLLEYFSDNEATQILAKIAEKIKPGGKLHIQGTDAHSMCYGVAYSQIDIMTFKALIFNNQKNNIYTISQLKNNIQTNISALEINKIKFINGLQYYIECLKK